MTVFHGDGAIYLIFLPDATVRNFLHSGATMLIDSPFLHGPLFSRH